MYILKNALKCISRSKGRNILIGVIVLVIAFSSCIGLSIREAAEKSKADTLDGLSISAVISFDRSSVMSKVQNSTEQSENGTFDKKQFAELMSNASSLSLDDYLKYATAESVKDFYYSETVSVNGSENVSPVTSDISEEDTSANDGMSKGGMSGGYSSSDFKMIGYSGENAMTSFINGTAVITEGAVFEEGTERWDCIISQELAAFNDISVGDTIIVTNPDNSEESYSLTVVGLYVDSSSNESVFSGRGGMSSSDPANQIYVSSKAVENMISASTEANQSDDEESAGALTATISGTYIFSDPDAYSSFEEEARALGLDDSYTITSADLMSYENSLTPLNTLSSTAGWFLVVILCIGAIILVVLNIFNVRERKYEIGVLTAMGMSKGKVAFQFLTEIFVVTLASVIVGAFIGAASSVPVTNALLQNQIEAQTEQSAQFEQNFGRGGNKTFISDTAGMNSVSANTTNYISEIDSATNMTVLLEMLGIAVLLTLISGMVSMLFIMRYEPLKILANRD